MPQRKIPLRVLLIGFLFCLTGAEAAWKIITHLMVGKYHVALGIFMLPVGIGLLRGKESSRKWARFWLIIGMLGLILFAYMKAFAWPGGQFTLFGRRVIGRQAEIIFWGSMVGFFILTILQYALLNSQKADEYFAARNDAKEPPTADSKATQE